MLGKHFLIRSLDRDKTARQYTICNVLRPELYEELTHLLRTGEKNMSKLINLLNSKDTNNMIFTVKDYGTATGISHKLHTQDNLDYIVKGPMGKRLEVQPTGLYYCFAAGTGVLPFMDLLA